MVPYAEFMNEVAKVKEAGTEELYQNFGVHSCPNCYYVSFNGRLFKGAHEDVAAQMNFMIRGHGYRMVLELDVAKQQLHIKVHKPGDTECSGKLSSLSFFIFIFTFKSM